MEMVTLDELARVVGRIDKRTERIAAALFEGEGDVPSITTRVALVENAIAEQDGERRVAAFIAGVGTLLGAGLGAAIALIGILGRSHP